MNKLVFLLISFCFLKSSLAQVEPAVIDSFKVELSKVGKTDEEKITLQTDISRLLLYVDMNESDKYAQMAIETAELSRDRKLMVRALAANGLRYSYLSGRKENIDKAIDYFNKALSLAKTNKLDTMAAKVYIQLSGAYRMVPDFDKALESCNQAYSYINNFKDDSLSVAFHLEYGSVYLQKKERILALRNYLTALQLAEKLKDKERLRSAYNVLSIFYADIKDFDKAIDYATKGLKLLDGIVSGQAPYNRVQDINRIGDLYSLKGSHDIAMSFYEKSIALSDSLSFAPLKVIGYRSIVNNYLQANEPQKALDYFKSHPEITEFLQQVNLGYFVDQSYAFIYTSVGKYDSAKYYFQKAAPFFVSDASGINQYAFYAQYGLMYKQSGELDKATHYFLLAKEKADALGDLSIMHFVSNHIDSILRKKGDFKQALYYSDLAHQYKDSLETLGKEKDLMQAEAADEQLRQERLQKENDEKKIRRHNIQYRIITFGIIGLVILLVVFGMFKISATTIHMLAFFTFLLLFEFIFLLLKKQGHSLTEGEPWKDLLLMIIVAAFLLPLHHWVEKKAIAWLTSHNRLTASGKGFLDKFKKKKTDTN